MKTRNRILFHCLYCGRVVHAEFDEPTPFCCEQCMTNAATETVADEEQFELSTRGERISSDDRRAMI
jgi:hypothetical protein